jgi:hypothetical protein
MWQKSEVTESVQWHVESICIGVSLLGISAAESGSYPATISATETFSGKSKLGHTMDRVVWKSEFLDKMHIYIDMETPLIILRRPSVFIDQYLWKSELPDSF